jgi:hypothetical protein
MVVFDHGLLVFDGWLRWLGSADWVMAHPRLAAVRENGLFQGLFMGLVLILTGFLAGIGLEFWVVLGVFSGVGSIVFVALHDKVWRGKIGPLPSGQVVGPTVQIANQAGTTTTDNNDGRVAAEVKDYAQLSLLSFVMSGLFLGSVVLFSFWIPLLPGHETGSVGLGVLIGFLLSSGFHLFWNHGLAQWYGWALGMNSSTSTRARTPVSGTTSSLVGFTAENENKAEDENKEEEDIIHSGTYGTFEIQITEIDQKKQLGIKSLGDLELPSELPPLIRPEAFDDISSFYVNAAQDKVYFFGDIAGEWKLYSIDSHFNLV